MDYRIYKFRKIQCFNEAIEYMLVAYAGSSHMAISGMVRGALIAQQRVSCTDGKTLKSTFEMRATQLLDFDPFTTGIDFTADLLYPDIAFGALVDDGVIYEKTDFDHICLHVFFDGREEVAAMQREYQSGENLAELLIGPDEWTEVENITGYFEDCILK